MRALLTDLRLCHHVAALARQASVFYEIIKHETMRWVFCDSCEHPTTATGMDELMDAVNCPHGGVPVTFWQEHNELVRVWPDSDEVRFAQRVTQQGGQAHRLKVHGVIGCAIRAHRRSVNRRRYSLCLRIDPEDDQRHGPLVSSSPAEFTLHKHPHLA
jgi:hypothetical protein